MLHIVTGAPCSGKTTYVNEHAKENSVIIDTDALNVAFGSKVSHMQDGDILDFSLNARKSAIEKAMTSNADVWLIDSYLNDDSISKYKGVNAEIITLDTPIDVCLERAKDRPQGTSDIIRKWFAKNTQLEESKMTVEVQETNTQEVAEKTSKTFTQDEVNAIIGERLAKEKAKYSDYDDLKQKASQFEQFESMKTQLTESKNKVLELQTQIDEMNKSNEIRNMKDKVSKETGVPINLLTATTEEGCKEQAQAILLFAKPTYPNIKDGGELQSKPQKVSVEQQFADWFNECTK